jgi:sec-independent protein translocase protein TatC
MRLPKRLQHGDTAELVEHLGELRGRLVVSLSALALGTAVAFVFRDHLIGWLNAPLDGRKPITLNVAEPFTTSLKVSLMAGFALALPVILWQVWAFLSPAVGRGAQRSIGALVALASGLLVAGVAFGYFVALPAAVSFLTNFDSNLYDIQIRASTYYSFAILVLASVGVVFELPIFILALVRLGVTSSARLRRNRRIGYVAMAVLAVALPGIDPVTTAFEMVPLMVLFEGSIWLCVILERRWAVSAQLRAAVEH